MTTDLLLFVILISGVSLPLFLVHSLRQWLTSGLVFAFAGILTLLFWQMMQVGWWFTVAFMQVDAARVGIAPTLMLGMAMVYAMDGILASRTYLLVLLITGSISWAFAEFTALLARLAPIPHGFELGTWSYFATLIGLIAGAVAAATVIAFFRRISLAGGMAAAVAIGTLVELAVASLIGYGPIMGFYNLQNQAPSSLLFSLPPMFLAASSGWLAQWHGDLLPIRPVSDLLRFWRTTESNLRDAREDVLAAKRIISELRMLNSQLSEAKRIHDHQVFYNPLGIVYLDRNGVITFANPAAEQFLEAPSELLIGQSLASLLVSKPPISVPELNRMAILRDSRLHEIHPASSNRSRWIDLMVMGFHDRDGCGSGFHLLLKEVTRKVKATRRQNIEDKIRSLHQTSRLIIHDFSNLMIGIHGVVDTAKAALRNHEPVHYQHLLETIETGITRGESMLRQLGDFPIAPLRMTTANLGKLLDEAVALIRPALARQDIRLDYPEFPECYVHVDTSQIERLFANLFSNAIRAMSLHGGKLAIDLAPTHENGVTIRISDNGIGMTEAQLVQAFDPGFSTKGQGQGGLGLPISFLIVDAHGGEIILTRNTMGGITSSIWLPLAESKPASCGFPVDHGVILGFRDEPFNDHLATVLDIAGVVVVDVQSSDELSAILSEEAHSWRLLLTDQIPWTRYAQPDLAVILLNEARLIQPIQHFGLFDEDFLLFCIQGWLDQLPNSMSHPLGEVRPRPSNNLA